MNLYMKGGRTLISKIPETIMSKSKVKMGKIDMPVSKDIEETSNVMNPKIEDFVKPINQKKLSIVERTKKAYNETSAASKGLQTIFENTVKETVKNMLNNIIKKETNSLITEKDIGIFKSDLSTFKQELIKLNKKTPTKVVSRYLKYVDFVENKLETYESSDNKVKLENIFISQLVLFIKKIGFLTDKPVVKSQIGGQDDDESLVQPYSIVPGTENIPGASEITQYFGEENKRVSGFSWGKMLGGLGAVAFVGALYAANTSIKTMTEEIPKDLTKEASDALFTSGLRILSSTQRNLVDLGAIDSENKLAFVGYSEQIGEDGILYVSEMYETQPIPMVGEDAPTQSDAASGSGGDDQDEPVTASVGTTGDVTDNTPEQLQVLQDVGLTPEFTDEQIDTLSLDKLELLSQRYSLTEKQVRSTHRYMGQLVKDVTETLGEACTTDSTTCLTELATTLTSKLDNIKSEITKKSGKIIETQTTQALEDMKDVTLATVTGKKLSLTGIVQAGFDILSGGAQGTVDKATRIALLTLRRRLAEITKIKDSLVNTIDIEVKATGQEIMFDLEEAIMRGSSAFNTLLWAGGIILSGLSFLGYQTYSILSQPERLDEYTAPTIEGMSVEWFTRYIQGRALTDDQNSQREQAGITWGDMFEYLKERGFTILSSTTESLPPQIGDSVDLSLTQGGALRKSIKKKKNYGKKKQSKKGKKHVKKTKNAVKKGKKHVKKVKKTKKVERTPKRGKNRSTRRNRK